MNKLLSTVPPQMQLHLQIHKAIDVLIKLHDT